jgi:hypothetical protein
MRTIGCVMMRGMIILKTWTNLTELAFSTKVEMKTYLQVINKQLISEVPLTRCKASAFVS